MAGRLPSWVAWALGLGLLLVWCLVAAALVTFSRLTDSESWSQP